VIAPALEENAAHARRLLYAVIMVRPQIATACGLLAAACTLSDTGQGGQDRGAPPQLETPPKVTGIDSVTLGLVFEIEGAPQRTLRAIQAWFQEAIGQGPWLDIDNGSDWQHRLVVRGEVTSAASTLTTAYTVGDQTVALAGVRGFARHDLTSALDRLALETRRGLGEPDVSILAHRRSVEAIVSADERVAAACAVARRLVDNRRLPGAATGLRRALQFDPSCALAISMAAGVHIDQGQTRRAVELAQRVLRLPERASPAAMHRATRVLLLSQRRYAELVDNGAAAARARPRDPQPLFSQALGLSMLTRYDEALPLLERLEKRLPHSPGVVFCLGHAQLSAGKIDRVLKLLPRIEESVPPIPVARLRAWTLFAAKRYDDLGQHLEQLAGRPEFRSFQGRVNLLGMHAAQAIASKRDDDAARLLLERLELLRSSPTLLARSGRLLIDTAWVMARLGRADDCDRALAALRGKQGLPDSARADGMVADGLTKLAQGKPFATTRLKHLDDVGRTSWRYRLEAARDLANGNTARARLALRQATTGSDDPSLIWEIAGCERALGRVKLADQLLDAAASELEIPRMDTPARHPSVDPKLAFVWRAGRR
jgi:tetratricopeptide (TPR) repeat protein